MFDERTGILIPWSPEMASVNDSRGEIDRLLIVGDVHGKQEQFVGLVSPYKYSLQVGDMGFDYDTIKENLDPDNHKFVGGNHDNYDIVKNVPHYLGDYGTWEIPEFGKIWFMRGAWSIDQMWRKPHVSWWEEEQLTTKQCNEAFDSYMEHKPDFVVTHDCPRFVYSWLGISPNGYVSQITPEALQAMFDSHKPKMWFFGHHHRSLIREIDGCTFVCLPELVGIEVLKNE